MAFGIVLREERQKAGISQGDLARGAGVDRAYPSSLERGVRCPSLTVVVSISRALKMTAPQLVRKTMHQLERWA